jgi:hypothetical protein
MIRFTGRDLYMQLRNTNAIKVCKIVKKAFGKYMVVGYVLCSCIDV